MCTVDWDAWAAIGTLVAAFVALFVGLLPELVRRYGAKRKLLAYLYLAKHSLRRQIIYVSNAIELCAVADIGPAPRHRIDIEMKFLDVSVLKQLLPHSAELLPETVEVISKCIVNMEGGILSAGLAAGIKPGQAFIREELEFDLVEVYRSITEAHDSVARYLKYDHSEFPKPSGVVAGALRHYGPQRR